MANSAEDIAQANRDQDRRERMALDHLFDVFCGRLSPIACFARRHPDVIRGVLGRISRPMKDRFGMFAAKRSDCLNQLSEVIA